MSGSDRTMVLAALDRDRLRHSLESAGLRCTPQRLAVYDQLAASDHHPTAEEVFHAVRATMPKISLATVYKALEALVEVGAATRLTAVGGSGPARYDARSDQHYHFRCLRTGAVHDLPTPFDPELISRLDPKLPEVLRSQGLRVVGYRLELLGYFDPKTGPARAPGDADSVLNPSGSPGPLNRPSARDAEGR